MAFKRSAVRSRLSPPSETTAKVPYYKALAVVLLYVEMDFKKLLTLYTNYGIYNRFELVQTKKIKKEADENEKNPGLEESYVMRGIVKRANTNEMNVNAFEKVLEAASDRKEKKAVLEWQLERNIPVKEKEDGKDFEDCGVLKNIEIGKKIEYKELSADKKTKLKKVEQAENKKEATAELK